jgi:hypothetical protein
VPAGLKFRAFAITANSALMHLRASHDASSPNREADRLLVGLEPGRGTDYGGYSMRCFCREYWMLQRDLRGFHAKGNVGVHSIA